MDTRPPFLFASVEQLEREATRQESLAVLPEMTNISEHTEELPGGRTARMRRFDPGAGSATPPAAAVLMGPAVQRRSEIDDSFSRFMAEAVGLPVVSVHERHATTPMDRDWITSWWRWCSESGGEIGLDPASIVLLARGEYCGPLLNAVSTLGAAGRPRPAGQFLLCGDFSDVDPSLVHALSRDVRALPPTYIATSSVGSERTRSRRMSAYLLDHDIECWYVEWPGVTARCLDSIDRVPEMERYIDAMVVTLRGLLSIAPQSRTGAPS
ncbi:MAG: hypothetical protein RIE77_08115 [Phycisphaerales bacterium]|jgi:acetyl esterase/lipase